jgi:Cu-Zn family superoxide dismutase
MLTVTEHHLTTDEWNIGSGDPTKDILGKGLIVHEGTDDFVSQPSGNAGARSLFRDHQIM